MHDQVQPALEVVEYRHFLGQHQQHVGRAQLVGAIPLRQPRLDVANRLEAEVADQAAAKCGQLRQARHVVLRAQVFDFREWVVEMAALGDLAGVLHFELMPAQAVYAFRREADDRIAPPGGAALDRFEQESVRAVSEFQVHRQRRIEVGKHLAHQRDARVALGNQRVEFVSGDHVGPVLSNGSVNDSRVVTGCLALTEKFNLKFVC